MSGSRHGVNFLALKGAVCNVKFYISNPTAALNLLVLLTFIRGFEVRNNISEFAI